MKKSLFYAFVALLMPLAISCQQENIHPSGALIGSSDNTTPVKVVTCKNFSYFNKYEGDVYLGNALGNYLLVKFNHKKDTPSHMNLLLKQPQFEAIDSEFFLDSGPISIIRLKAGSTCLEAEQMVIDLLESGFVSYAGHVFNPHPVYEYGFLFKGVTNEFIVSFEGSENYADFMELVKKSNTRIVTLLAEFDGFYVYILSVDKKASGNTLTICSLFNQQSYVDEAIPNFYYQLQFSESEIIPFSPVTTTAEQIRLHGMDALKRRTTP